MDQATKIPAIKAPSKPGFKYFRIESGRYMGCYVKEGSRGYEAQKPYGLTEVRYVDIEQGAMIIFRGV